MNTNNRAMGRAWPLALALLCPASGWAYYICQPVNLQVVNIDYNGSPADASQSFTVACSRQLDHPDRLWYRAKADLGNHPTGTQPYRSAQLGGGGTRLAYSLSRSSSCSNNSNWLGNDASSSDAIVDYVPYPHSTSIFGVDHQQFCIRVLGPVSPFTDMPTAGIYQDQFRLTVEFPDSNPPARPYEGPPGPITAVVSVQIHVASHCKLRAPDRLVLNYRSFSRGEVWGTTRAGVSCSAKLPWTATIHPPGGKLLGLDYTLSLRHASGTGYGGQGDLTITGTLPAGQPGTCAGALCTLGRTHTLTIAY